MKKKQIYMITYPNRKIYIGKDLTGTLLYFGSVDPEYVAKDFEGLNTKTFIIRKDILWESTDSTDHEVNQKEVEFIRKYKSNNPNVGYNRWPKYTE